MSSHLLHLMRHGAPKRTGLLLGRTDAAPDPTAIDACIRQASDLPFTAIIASDLMRASVPANSISEARGISVRRDPRWRELDFGAWDGLAPAQIDAAAMTAFWDDPDTNPPPNGERWSALTARVAAALDDIAVQDTLVITHGGAIRAAMACLFGFDQRQLWTFDLPYAAVLSLRIWPGPPRSAQIAGLWS